MSIAASVCETFELKNEFLSAISVTKNFKEMTSTNVGKSEVAVLNGIRVLITLMMVLSHKLMEFYYFSLTNRETVNEDFNSALSIPFR